MLNKAAYRLRKDGKSDHASWWVFPVVWCRWWIVWDPERIPVAHHTSAHGAQMYISWYELFECGQLNKIGTRPRHFLGCQMTIPVCEVSSGGQLYQMQHWDQGEPVLPLHECRQPVGGHSEHITGPSQCYAVGDMLIDILHTDRLFSDGRQAAHIQCAL